MDRSSSKLDVPSPQKAMTIVPCHRNILKGTSQVLRADNFTLPVKNKVFVDVPTAIFDNCARRDYRIKVASRRGSAVKANFERMIGSNDELCVCCIHNSNNIQFRLRTGQASSLCLRKNPKPQTPRIANPTRASEVRNIPEKIFQMTCETSDIISITGIIVGIESGHLNKNLSSRRRILRNPRGYT